MLEKIQGQDKNTHPPSAQIVGWLTGPESSGSDFRVSRKTLINTKASSTQGKVKEFVF